MLAIQTDLLNYYLKEMILEIQFTSWIFTEIFLWIRSSISFPKKTQKHDFCKSVLACNKVYCALDTALH